MNPRTSAIAYRIWAYANPRGWDCTVREISDELGENMYSVRKICANHGWNHRLRVARRDMYTGPSRQSLSKVLRDDDYLEGHFI